MSTRDTISGGSVDWLATVTLSYSTGLCNKTQLDAQNFFAEKIVLFCANIKYSYGLDDHFLYFKIGMFFIAYAFILLRSWNKQCSDQVNYARFKYLV